MIRPNRAHRPGRRRPSSVSGTPEASGTRSIRRRGTYAVTPLVFATNEPAVVFGWGLRRQTATETTLSLPLEEAAGPAHAEGAKPVGALQVAQEAFERLRQRFRFARGAPHCFGEVSAATSKPRYPCLYASAEGAFRIHKQERSLDPSRSAPEGGAGPGAHLGLLPRLRAVEDARAVAAACRARYDLAGRDGPEFGHTTS